MDVIWKWGEGGLMCEMKLEGQGGVVKATSGGRDRVVTSVGLPCCC